ncbi:MAG TPA: cyclic nucleotide-binding domain-containing protein [Acidimicrobiia bacterium]|nr:cyclic nucleotide-binding domain-containing protein [Acidimicrobiia bacterium]
MRSVVVGIVAGLVSVTLAVALAALVFSGDLADHRAAGIGLALFGTSAIALVTALGSSLPGMLAGTQDNTSALLALAAASVVGRVPSEAVLPTVVAVTAVAAAALGLLLLLLGSMRLGRLVRYLPFPVVAGLLAGTGVVIVVFSWEILVGGVGFAEFLRNASSEESLVRWVPGVLIAVALLLGTRGVLGPRMAAVAVFAGLGSTYGWLLSSGETVDAAQRSGLLLGSFEAGPAWTPATMTQMVDADWGAVLGQAGVIGTMLLIVPVALLLSVGAIELAVKRDLAGDRELRVAGLGNLAASLGGGLPGYHYVADTVLAARLAPPTRLTAVVSACTVIAMTVGGAPVLGLIPTSFIAAVLLFIGATFVLEWTWDARSRLPSDDMAVVLIILVVIAFVGFLPGVAVGLGATIVLFAVRSSRLEVVKYELDGTGYRSRVDRHPEARALLDRLGSRLLILELQAYLFFGTADRLRTRVEERIEEGGLTYVILGFRHVTGMDSSAILAFEKLARLAEANDVTVMVAGARGRLAAQVSRLEQSPAVVTAPDVDRAVELAEEGLLAESAPVGVVEDQASRFAAITDRFTPVSLSAGEYLMTQDAPSNGLFLIRSGRVSVELQTDSGTARLRSMGSGAVVGEVALYLGGLCTASVVADTEVEALRLSPGAFAEMQHDDPAAAAALNRMTAGVLALRLEAADQMIERLLS